MMTSKLGFAGILAFIAVLGANSLASSQEEARPGRSNVKTERFFRAPPPRNLDELPALAIVVHPAWKVGDLTTWEDQLNRDSQDGKGIWQNFKVDVVEDASLDSLPEECDYAVQVTKPVFFLSGGSGIYKNRTTGRDTRAARKHLDVYMSCIVWHQSDKTKRWDRVGRFVVDARVRYSNFKHLGGGTYEFYDLSQSQFEEKAVVDTQAFVKARPDFDKEVNNWMLHNVATGSPYRVIKVGPQQKVPKQKEPVPSRVISETGSTRVEFKLKNRLTIPVEVAVRVYSTPGPNGKSTAQEATRVLKPSEEYTIVIDRPGGSSKEEMESLRSGERSRLVATFCDLSDK